MGTVIGLVVAGALIAGSAGSVHALNVGDKAPDFTLNGPTASP